MVDLVQMVLTLSILGVYSHYYKDNPLYSVIESLTVGIYAGINVVESIRTIYFQELTAVPTKPDLIIPILLGIALLILHAEGSWNLQNYTRPNRSESCRDRNKC